MVHHAGLPPRHGAGFQGRNREVPCGSGFAIRGSEVRSAGEASPNPPSEALAAYYAWLEEEHGYRRTWVRTDFRFRSRAEAEALLRFFFEELYDERWAGREDLADLPECTGLWWRTH